MLSFHVFFFFKNGKKKNNLSAVFERLGSVMVTFTGYFIISPFELRSEAPLMSTHSVRFCAEIRINIDPELYKP